MTEEREKPHSFSRKNGAPDLAFRACSFRKSVPPAARGAVTSPFIRCMIKLLRSVSSVFKAIWTVMDLREALSNADQILDEERIHPTVKYDCLPQERDSVTRALVAVAGSTNLQAERSYRPRQIIEQPTWYRFKSTNYNLLCALLSRFDGTGKNGFLGGVSTRMVTVPGCTRKNHAVAFPGWNKLVSEALIGRKSSR